MKIYTDKPIVGCNQDILGRNKLAECVANAILSYSSCPTDTDESFVIGIQGKWGSGKTSLMQMVEEKLSGHGDSLVIVNMNSWLLTNEKQMMREFFKSFLDIINDAEKSLNSSVQHMVLSCKMKMKTYFDAILESTSLSISPALEGIRPSISFSLKNFMNTKSMYIQKNDVSEIMKKNDKYIVFFIDDIDRLNEDEIATLFKLVKNIADFPKVIYVLAYDVDIVTSALNKIHLDKGDGYIEKVIQYTINVPFIRKDVLADYFMSEFANIISDIDGICDKEKVLSKLTFDSIFHEIFDGVFEYIDTIRNCKRILNCFAFEYGALHDNVYYADLLALLVLRLYENDIYKYIYNHPCELFIKSALFMDKDEQIAQTALSAMLSGVPPQKKESVKNMLFALFPSLAYKIRKYTSSMENGNSIYFKHRLCCDDYFYVYFQTVLFDDDIDNAILKQILENKDRARLLDLFVKMGNKGAFSKLCRAVSALIDIKSLEHISIDFDLAYIVFVVLSQPIAIKKGSTFDYPYWAKCALVTTMMNHLIVCYVDAPHRPLHNIVDILKNEAIDEDVALSIIVACCSGTSWCASIQDNAESREKLIHDESLLAELQKHYIERVKKDFKKQILGDEVCHIGDYAYGPLKLFSKHKIDYLMNGFIDKIPETTISIYNMVTFYLRVNYEMNGEYVLNVWPQNIPCKDIKNLLFDFIEEQKGLDDSEKFKYTYEKIHNAIKQ